MVTIVFAHPWHGSFNKAILDKIVEKLENDKKEFQVIDLNKDNFNPVVTEADLKLYSKGGYTDPLVTKYQEMVKKTDKMVFIFPMWWHTAPAILKGFFDKVMLLNFGFDYEGGWNPLLGIKNSLVITTSDGPTERFRSSIEGEFVPDMLHSVGITGAKWMNIDQITSCPMEKRLKFLDEVANEF